MTNIGAALKAERLSQGLSLSAVSKLTGFSTSSIKNMEANNGKILWSRYYEYGAVLGLQLTFGLK